MGASEMQGAEEISKCLTGTACVIAFAGALLQRAYDIEVRRQ